MAHIDQYIDRIEQFRKDVWDHYRAVGRHDLPWRKTKDPYRIMVSEVMLQQTQVPRVLEKYREFLKAFPNIRALAKAPLSDVLRVWSGMGYNRRGKYLKDAAVEIVKRYDGKLPHDVVSLRALPGIGPYTASAVAIFAFNTPDTLIETNVRTAFIHAFLAPKGVIHPNRRGQTSVKKVSDRDLLPLIAKAAEGQDPRTWHWALMDYGSHLKKLHKNPGRASAHYIRQSKFDGSLRQVRGAILRELHNGACREHTLLQRLNRSKISSLNLDISGRRLDDALAGLARDGMIREEKGQWRIA